MRHTFVTAVAAGMACLALVHPAAALEELKDEKERLKACEKQVCTLVTKKAPETGSLSCNLTKTWHRTQLKDGSKAGNLTWGFGDARCSVDLKIDNAAVVGALKDGEATLQLADHTVSCLVEHEGSDPTTVKMTLAPKATFKNGKAEKVWINLKEVDGPTAIKGLAFSVAKLEDSVGIFHKYLIAAINDLVGKSCPKVMSGS